MNWEFSEKTGWNETIWNYQHVVVARSWTESLRKQVYVEKRIRTEHTDRLGVDHEVKWISLLILSNHLIITLTSRISLSITERLVR